MWITHSTQQLQNRGNCNRVESGSLVVKPLLLFQKFTSKTSFLDNIPVFGSEKFSNLNLSTDRLDELFSTHMNTEPYQRLFKVVPLLLVLSRGQASVERGFSVNKELEVENLSNQSHVAQRLVCDHVKAVDGILNVPITQALLTSCASA